MFGRERVVGVADGNAFREGFLGKTFHCVKFCFGSRALLGNSCKIRFVYMIFVFTIADKTRARGEDVQRVWVW
jgi:hypothetical protein